MATNFDLRMFERVLSGKMKFHELDAALGPVKAADARLKALEKNLGKSLSPLSPTIDPAECTPNIENMIGTISVPLGIAGPVHIKGEYAKGDYYLPLATTEGALVASVNRGIKAINLSGGSETAILKDGQTRSLLFKLRSIKEVKQFRTWVNRHHQKIKNIAEKDSRHLQMKDIDTYCIGTSVWLRITATTDDAMGMNMITIAAKNVGEYINAELDYVHFLTESGNRCVDKKPSALGLQGRGKKVVASVLLPDKVIREVFKTSPALLKEVNYKKNYLGSASSGSLGFNAQFSNIIAAMFLATGQDMAHVVEGSLGFTTIEEHEAGSLAAVTLPALQLGTLGGGTSLPSQQASLSILCVEGSGSPAGSNVRTLAEIVSVGVLAGELSLLGALCSRHLALSHKKLNR